MTMPTDDFEYQLFEDVRSKYNNLHRVFKEEEKLISQQFGENIIPNEWADEGLEPTIPPTFYNAIENASDHILTFPRITVPVRPSEEGMETEREIAERKRQFFEMFWNRVFSEQGDPLGRVVKPLLKGKGVLKKEIEWRFIPDLPEDATRQQKRAYRRQVEKAARSRMLQRVKMIPKETVYEDLESPYDPSYVFESYEITVHEARRRFLDGREDEDYPEKLAERIRGMQPLDKVPYVEYWSKPEGSSQGQYIQWVDRERVHSGVNPYSWETPSSTKEDPDYTGYVPYVIGDPGWGDPDSANKPEDRCVSLIRPIISVGKAEARFLTELEAWLRMYVFPVLVTTNMPDSDENPIELGPGAHLDKTEDQELELLTFGEAPVSLLQGMQRVNQYADESAKFGALGGIPQRGVDTATEADQHMRNAATRLSGPIKTLRRMVITLNAWVLMDIEHILGVPVTLSGVTDSGTGEVTLKPSEIKGYYQTNVQLETSDEAALNLRNARTWSDLFQRLPISPYTAMTKAGIQNPSHEMDERLIADLERSPQAQQLLLLMMLAGFGDVGNVVSQAFQQSLVSGQGAQPQQQPQQPATPVNPVEAMRQQSQQQAVEASPERAMF